MSLLASCWCPEEVGLQMMFEELQIWLSSYRGGFDNITRKAAIATDSQIIHL